MKTQFKRFPDFLNEEAIELLKAKYLRKGETAKDMYHRLAIGAQEICPQLEGLEKALYECFSNGWISPATPVANSFGRPLLEDGLNTSCFGLAPGNSILSIFGKAQEAAMLSKNGGGLGIDLSSLIGDSPVTHWASIYDRMAATVSQKNRRGSVALYLDAYHPDVNAFLTSKDLLRSGDDREKLDCNIAIKLNDEFMLNLLSNGEYESALFSKILEMRMKYGSPYLMFIDNAQNDDPPWYKDKGLQTQHSQLCLTGDTLVQTNEGMVRIEELVGKEVTIFDGKNWVKNSSFIQTGETHLTLRFTLEDGSTIETTDNHRMLFQSGEVRPAIFASKGDVLKTWNRRESDGLKITNVGYLDHLVPVPVYCTQVKSTSFFGLANGVLTGNCSEIFQHSDPEHTYTCVLSSLVLSRYEQWKNKKYQINDQEFSVPALGLIFLDAVCEELIQKGSQIKGIEPAIRSAIKGRAVGLGTLGLHCLLQKKGLIFGSTDALRLDGEIHSFIDRETQGATQYLAEVLGEPEWCKGWGIRNSVRLAIAPTLSNSVICNGGSAGVEPIKSNAYVYEGPNGIYIRKNKTLEEVLINLDMNTKEVWDSIVEHDGSVQQLNNLPSKHKQVFKTALEINQFSVVRHAGIRQKYIDQGQSLNLFFRHDESAETIAGVHIDAWSRGLKSLYYIRSTNPLNQSTNRVSTDLEQDKPHIGAIHIKTRSDCAYCIKAKELLCELGLNYTEEVKPQGRVPEIYINGEVLPDGYTSLKSLLQVDDTSEEGCLGCDG